MKIAPTTPPATTVPRSPAEGVVAAAKSAVLDGIAAGAPPPSLVERFGETLGLGLGVLVTEALAVVPSWNAPLRDAAGKPVEHVAGADRVGTHDLRKRHEEVVGPKIAALVSQVPAGVLRDLVDGLARGATAAPGTSYRLEAAVADVFETK